MPTYGTKEAPFGASSFVVHLEYTLRMELSRMQAHRGSNRAVGTFNNATTTGGSDPFGHRISLHRRRDKGVYSLIKVSAPLSSPSSSAPIASAKGRGKGENLDSE